MFKYLSKPNEKDHLETGFNRCLVAYENTDEIMSKKHAVRGGFLI